MVILIIFIGFIFAVIGAYIADEKGRDTAEGALFGFFLGIFGVIIVGLLPNKEKFYYKHEGESTYKKSTIKDLIIIGFFTIIAFIIVTIAFLS